MNKALRLITACAFLLPISSTGWPQDSAATQPLSELERSALSPSRTMLALGEKVSSTACAGCHGGDGVSSGAGVPNLAGQRTAYLYRVLQAYQSRQRQSDDMNHAIGFLNNEALLAVAAYYASLAPARPDLSEEITPGGLVADGDPFAVIKEDMKKCVKCHGEDGNSSASGMPNLTAQDSAYFASSMVAYRDGSRNHGLMKKLAGNLDDETLSRMGVFYAVQEPVRTGTAGDGNTDLGRALSEGCSNCHGADGNAAGSDMPTLAGQDARYFIKAMKAYKEGKRANDEMFEAADKLTDTDLDNLATYYAVQEPVRRDVRTPLTTAEWLERCERCHGIDGNSTDPRFPMLAGQDRTYLANALQAYIGKSRGNSIMHAMSQPLNAADLESIVGYYSTREPKSVIYMQLPCDKPAED